MALIEPVDPAEALGGTAILLAAYAGPAQFLAAIDPHSASLSLDTRARPARGTDVVVEVFWPGLPNRVYVRAEVCGATPTGRLVVAPSRDEQRKLAFLMATARGDGGGVYPRRHRRYCVRIPLSWRPFGSTHMWPGVAEDLSSGGVSIASARFPVREHESVVLRMQADWSHQDLVLTGAVRHVRVRSDRDMIVGVGFHCASAADRRDLRRLLRAFAGRGVVVLER